MTSVVFSPDIGLPRDFVLKVKINEDRTIELHTHLCMIMLHSQMIRSACNGKALTELDIECPVFISLMEDSEDTLRTYLSLMYNVYGKDLMSTDMTRALLHLDDYFCSDVALHAIGSDRCSFGHYAVWFKGPELVDFVKLIVKLRPYYYKKSQYLWESIPIFCVKNAINVMITLGIKLDIEKISKLSDFDLNCFKL